MKNHRVWILACAFWAAQAGAVGVQVVATGSVEFNQITTGPFADFDPGDAVTLSFTLDSDDFDDNPRFPTRGYVIAPASFAISDGSTSVGIADPFPPGRTPYFVIRNDDPAVDGFFVSTSTGSPTGIPTDAPGIFGAFTVNFSVTYENDPLPSLDILDALGTYDFTGLSVFSFGVDDGGFEPLGIVFNDLTLSAVPVPGALWLLGSALVGLGSLRRERRRR